MANATRTTPIAFIIIPSSGRLLYPLLRSNQENKNDKKSKNRNKSKQRLLRSCAGSGASKTRSRMRIPKTYARRKLHHGCVYSNPIQTRTMRPRIRISQSYPVSDNIIRDVYFQTLLTLEQYRAKWETLCRTSIFEAHSHSHHI